MALSELAVIRVTSITLKQTGAAMSYFQTSEPRLHRRRTLMPPLLHYGRERESMIQPLLELQADGGETRLESTCSCCRCAEMRIVNLRSYALALRALEGPRRTLTFHVRDYVCTRGIRPLRVRSYTLKRYMSALCVSEAAPWIM